MSHARRSLTLLVAEDDPDDRLLARDALAQAPLPVDLRFVDDGVELLEYLRREGRYCDPGTSPWPDIILLDLNMPRKDGREVLQELKQGERELRRIPVIVMTTSQAEEDVQLSYDLGAAGYVTKPSSYEGLVSLMRSLGRYWAETVVLPAAP